MSLRVVRKDEDNLPGPVEKWFQRHNTLIGIIVTLTLIIAMMVICK